MGVSTQSTWGALVVRKERNTTNKYYILSIEELEQNLQMDQAKEQENEQSGMQPVTKNHAVQCRPSRQDAAPKTINETVKKQRTAKKIRYRPVRTTAQATALASLDCGIQFHGSSSSRRLILWSPMRARMSAR